MSTKPINYYPGKKYNLLTLVRFSHTDIAQHKNGRQFKHRWLCKCDCGNEKIVDVRSVHSGHTKSCGCLQGVARKLGRHIHGMTRTKEYRSWAHVLGRCLNPKNARYSYYGGRGIDVDPRWMDFTNFFADMGKAPQPFYSLDRIDPDKGYWEWNCRWADLKTQANNKRNTIYVYLNGEKLPRAVAEERMNLGRGTICRKKKDNNWSDQEAVDYYIKKRGINISIQDLPASAVMGLLSFGC